ncbi:MAG: SDR family oxidoreductase [Alphaproteobacteria bacterium]
MVDLVVGGPFSLDGKIALVTGASRGLGWAMARCMAEAGARVVLNGRDPATLAARIAELKVDGHQASTAPFDVSDRAAAAAGLKSVIADQGRLDVLVNNAGINRRKPLADLDDDDWYAVIETNLSACFALARHAGTAMAAQGWGRIIMTGSIMGFVARPGVAAYIAAKGGIAALTRSLAVELGPHGVTCNAIAPGYITTDMTVPLAADPAFDAKVKARTPVGRWGVPEDIGHAAVYLASDAASYVNGHILTVDGGMTVSI